MNEGSRIVQEGTETVFSAGKIIEEIVHATSSVAEIMKDIDKEMLEQQHESIEFVQRIGNITKLAEQTAINANQSFMKVGDQVESFNNISAATTQLSQMTEELSTFVGVFNVKH